MVEKILEEIHEKSFYVDMELAVNYEDVEEIVRKRMNDGWIPVSERLPEGNAINPVTCDAYVYPVTVDFGGVTDVRYYSFYKGHWYNQSPKIMDDLVTAWRERPDPYRKKMNS